MTHHPPTKRPPRMCLPCWLVLLAATAVAGCNGIAPGGDPLKELKQENARLKGDLQDLRTTLAEQKEQIETLQALGDKRLERLFHVTAITLGRYTAGVDLDDEAGDDGIRVYLVPRDRDGHTIKAAGAVRVQLFDLAADPKENLLGTFDFPVEDIGKLFASGFLTNHYKLDCRWKKPPANPDITVRVVFTDYLTGKTFTAQKVCKVDLPGQ